MESKYSIKDYLEVKVAAAPSFSSDGSRVAYLSNLTGTQQIYIVPTEGGDSVQLTDFPDPISQMSFSPTEDRILFSKDEGGNELAQLYLLDPETKEVIALTNNKRVRHDFGFWSADGKYFSFSSNERNGVDFDVYVMDVQTLEKRCVYNKGEWCEAAGFSPNGTYLVAKVKHSNVNTDLYLCNLRSGEIEHITPHEGDAVHGNPRWMPDESEFLVSTDHGREFIGLARYSLAKKSLEFVLTPKWDVDGVAFQKDARYIAITINEEGYDTITLYDPLTLQDLGYALPRGSVGGVRFSKDGKYMAFGFGDSTHTHDIWILDLSSKEYRQLTKSPQGVPAEKLVEPELVRFTSFDGLSVPAFVFRPKIGGGKKLPVIINIHGGPEGQWKPSLVLLTQYFVQQGYIVVAPNVRGSSGYGKTYLALDNIEKRLDSVKDIVALRGYLENLPEIDVTRIALMGGSYGGFMVLAGLAFYPELWAAGVDTVGIVNFVTFLENTAPYRRALREVEYGSLERDRELLQSISPINSIEKIRAPLFIIHGANDPRVPLSEAEQVVSKLKELGRRVEFLVYEDEGHGLGKLKNRLDAYPKVVAFLKEVFGE